MNITVRAIHELSPRRAAVYNIWIRAVASPIARMWTVGVSNARDGVSEYWALGGWKGTVRGWLGPGARGLRSVRVTLARRLARCCNVQRVEGRRRPRASFTRPLVTQPLKVATWRNRELLCLSDRLLLSMLGSVFAGLHHWWLLFDCWIVLSCSVPKH